MESRLLLGLVMVLWLVCKPSAQAQQVHYFDCKLCHVATLAITGLGTTQVCLTCHNNSPTSVTLTSGQSKMPQGLFDSNDASNALGSATAAGLMNPTKQTSHFWASPKDTMPAAGALPASRSLYVSSYGISTGKVTCTRCHDPHLPSTADPKLLRMSEAGDKICLDCHRPWKLSNNQGRETHPIVADYAAVAAAKPSKYKPAVTNVGQGDVRLIAGGVTCTSCHGTHFADSHSGSADGRDNRAGLLAGDGKLLRSDGPKRTGATVAATAQLRSNLCQACHTYKTHGDANPIGCLDCHSGHVYNNGDPNYYVLRAGITSVYRPKLGSSGPVANIQFKSATADWMNAGGTGYCQSCHTLVAPHNGLSSGTGAANSCGECHYHGHASRSFTASCADCHGTPPTSASAAPAAGGYAKSGSYDYSTSGVYKNETLTPHGSHAGGTDYRFACDVCHLGKSHATGTFQDVFKPGSIHALASGSGSTAPSYNGTGSGTCSAVYCHSNGGKRTGDGTRSYKTLAPTWAGQKNTINSCGACHGNSEASMGAGNRDNSTSHQKHLAKGYSCKVCHKNTADSSTALAADAIGGMHVNGIVDVFFDLTHNLGADTLKVGTTPYNPVTGTCAVYCHSNGAGTMASPDWDLAASGACGTCHAARVGDAAVIASGSHTKHVSDLSGPQLTCDACHGANAGSGAHASHVNGVADVPAAGVCTSCHAVDDGETTPVWGNPASSTCESCHGGATVSVIGGKPAPAKPLAASSGHNKPSGNYTLSGNAAANQTCAACHDAAAAGHFGASGDDRLSVGFACASCHAGVLTHQAKACVACHDPHGTSNASMIHSSQATQNAKDASASGKFSGNVVFTAKTGVNSYDELDAGAGANGDDLCASCHSSANGTSHNNRQVTGAAHNEGADCTSCHAHTKAFRPVGTACNQCHGNAPTTGAHAFHAIVADHTTAEDRTDCAVCHLGADSYTYDPSLDMAGGLNHSDAAGRKTKLATAVGFSVANQTCASACHKSTPADGAWADADGLACDSCHYWSATPSAAGNSAYTNAAGAAAPLGAKHSKHFALSMTCGNCHGSVTTDLSFKRGHNNSKAAATDADKIRYQGYGFLNAGGQGVQVDDSSFNSAVNSWINSAVTNDGGNTCANAACHNPSKTTYKADWDSDVASCSLCHSATDPATGAHGKHLTNRGAVYGGNLVCTTCHVDNGVNMAHRNGTVNLGLTPRSANCHTCHQRTGGSCTGCHFGTFAQIWAKTGVVTGCANCHAQTPTSNDHTLHISGTYGPLTGSDCSACHQSQANNTSMSGVATHMNLKVTLRNRAVPASPYEVTFNTIGQAANDAVDSCNACHGGAAAALLAKDYWTTASRVTCESCHGDSSLASRNADGSGVSAPNRAGAAFDLYGHGKVTTNPTYGGKQCADCHNSTVAHISGSLGDAKRLKVINSKNFQTPGQENDYCGVCHSFAAKTHFANSLTSGGASLNGNTCTNCHDVHGQNGNQAAMVRSSIGGRIVTGFSNKNARASYFVASPNSGGNNQYGICQVCHDPAEVSYFNTTTGNDAGHNPGQLCTNCHKHDDADGAFKANCTSCHGGGNNTPAANNIWSDDLPTSTRTAYTLADRAGAHLSHADAIGQKLANKTDIEWAGMSAAAKLPFQNNSCDYCHPNPGGTNATGGAHSAPVTGRVDTTADVHGDAWNSTKFKEIQNGAVDPDGLYNPTIKRCSNIDCHSNGEFTWTWYEDQVAPGQVTDLAAATGTAVGTVTLTWTPPRNDGATGPVSYGYEVRYRTGGAVTDANWGTSTIAGGAPSAVRNYPGVVDRTQTMTVQALTPGTTYHFAVKAFDETVVNKSPASNSVSAVAKIDNIAPVFKGLVSAEAAYATGAVDLAWNAASDDSGPVTYLIYSGLATLDTAALLATTPKTTQALKYQVTGLTDGLDYKFLVRARDAVSPTPNVDANQVVKEAIPQSPSENSINGKTYYAVVNTGTALGGGQSTNFPVSCGNSHTWVNGNSFYSLLQTGSYNCGDTARTRLQTITSVTTTNIITWVFNTAYAKKTYIHDASFALNMRERSGTPTAVQFELGYWNPTSGGFTATDLVSKTLAAGSRGTVKVYFPSVAGKIMEIPQGMKLAIRVKKPNANAIEIRFGARRSPSILTVYEQTANELPGLFAVSTPASPASGTINLSWGASTDPDGDPVTYDVFGSIDNGATWPYTIAKGLTTTSTSWNTKTAGIGLTAVQNGVRFRVGAADGMLHRIVGTGDPQGLADKSFHDHRYVSSNAFSVNNSGDSIPPAAISDLTAEHRPKTGTVYLYWHAPGDDGMEGKAAQYDIRYRLNDPDDIGNRLDTEGKWAAATQAVGEPVPGTPGKRQGYEVLGLTPGKSYYFAIKTADEAGNWSTLSNSPKAAGGQRCGVCHSTPPDDLATKGTHAQHGYTQTDCTKCHGIEADTMTPQHMDGVTKMAWNNPKKGYPNTAVGPTTLTGANVTYKNQAGSVTIYTDPNGGGGFNFLSGSDNKDNGTCFGFNATGVTGCHGSGTPVWDNPASVSCAMCHGDPNRTPYDYYGRPFEDVTTDTRYGGNVPIYKASPPIDMLGSSTSNAVGQHNRHLNFSYRLTGDQCALCHLGSDHADGTVNVKLHPAAGPNPVWTPAVGATPGTCSGTSTERCHGNNPTPPDWKPRTMEPNGTKLVKCNDCHGFVGKTFTPGNPGSSQIPHVKDGGQVRDCLWCHVEGHPQSHEIIAVQATSTARIVSPGHGLSNGIWIQLRAYGVSDADKRFAQVGVVDENTLSLTGVNGTTWVPANFLGGYWERATAPIGITAITGANPAVVTSTNHGLQTGDTILLSDVSGMTQVSRYEGAVTRIDANSFQLTGVNSTAYGVFSGSASFIRSDQTALVPNNALVGIDYTGGGIHLKKRINNRGPFNTEAEICWGCHDAQTPRISEWGYNGINNAKPTGGAITAINTTSKTITSNGHGLSNGDRIILYMPQGPVTRLHGWTGTVSSVAANTFVLDGVGTIPASNSVFTNARWKYATTYDNGYLHQSGGPWGGRTQTSNWVTGVWDSGNFPYKTAAVQSTHSVNSAASRPGLDDVSRLRCSYCHDVHDMNQSPNDTASGRPYLRGSWKGNPYLEDGAPGRNVGSTALGTDALRAEYYYVDGMDDYGMVPRGSIGMPKLGGYWIDQNSDFPTAGWTLGDSAGVCVLCHGTDVNNMNKFNVHADGTAEATKKSWVGTNGHSNAVLGGSGTNKYNAYDPALRREGTTYNQPGMGYQDTLGYGSSTTRMFGLRNNNEGSTGIADTARSTDNNMGVYPYAWSTVENVNRYAYDVFSWGVNREIGAANGEPMYHRFSCSKCHNPHASRLPRLMITNCLDVSHNKWDDTFAADPDWTSGATNDGTIAINWSTSAVMNHVSGSDVSDGVRARQFAYATSAQNCHRYVELAGQNLAITGISKANPAVVTRTAHGLATGTKVKLTVAGMTELNGGVYTITSTSANTFTLNGVNSTTFGTFTSGTFNTVTEEGWNSLTPWVESSGNYTGN